VGGGVGAGRRRRPQQEGQKSAQACQKGRDGRPGSIGVAEAHLCYVVDDGRQ
jgi:hypothetical protein